MTPGVHAHNIYNLALIPNLMEAEKFFPDKCPSLVIIMNIWFPESFIGVEKKSAIDDHNPNISSLELPPL